MAFKAQVRSTPKYEYTGIMAVWTISAEAKKARFCGFVGTLEERTTHPNLDQPPGDVFLRLSREGPATRHSWKHGARVGLGVWLPQSGPQEPLLKENYTPQPFQQKRPTVNMSCIL